MFKVQRCIDLEFDNSYEHPRKNPEVKVIVLSAYFIFIQSVFYKNIFLNWYKTYCGIKKQISSMIHHLFNREEAL